MMHLVDIASFLKNHGLAMKVSFAEGAWSATTWKTAEPESLRYKVVRTGRTLEDAVAAAIAVWKN